MISPDGAIKEICRRIKEGYTAQFICMSPGETSIEFPAGCKLIHLSNLNRAEISVPLNGSETAYSVVWHAEIVPSHTNSLTTALGGTWGINTSTHYLVLSTSAVTEEVKSEAHELVKMAMMSVLNISIEIAREKGRIARN